MSLDCLAAVWQESIESITWLMCLLVIGVVGSRGAGCDWGL